MYCLIESIQAPGVLSGFVTSTYASLFVGTLDWTEETQLEIR